MKGRATTEPWRRLHAPDADALRTFLLRNEDFAAGFSGRLLRDGELRIPGSMAGGVFGSFGPAGLTGAVLWSRTGTVFPIFEVPVSGEEGERLGRFFQGGGIASFLGPEADVEVLEGLLKAKPRVSTPYRYMYFGEGQPPACSPPPESGAVVRSAEDTDAAALFPLHSAYEREEVVTELHRFDARASRAALDKILDSETVAVAELDGRAVATARTNAKGFRTWQIGGVYVIPEFRGRGWGRFVMCHLIGVLAGAGKSAGLFVKERNLRARGLYLSLGFRDIGPFRVDYL